jgi:hypothetical protein
VARDSFIEFLRRTARKMENLKDEYETAKEEGRINSLGEATIF